MTRRCWNLRLRHTINELTDRASSQHSTSFPRRPTFSVAPFSIQRDCSKADGFLLRARGALVPSLEETAVGVSAVLWTAAWQRPPSKASVIAKRVCVRLSSHRCRCFLALENTTLRWCTHCSDRDPGNRTSETSTNWEGSAILSDQYSEMRSKKACELKAGTTIHGYMCRRPQTRASNCRVNPRDSCCLCHLRFGFQRTHETGEALSGWLAVPRCFTATELSPRRTSCPSVSQSAVGHPQRLMIGATRALLRRAFGALVAAAPRSRLSGLEFGRSSED